MKLRYLSIIPILAIIGCVAAKGVKTGDAFAPLKNAKMENTVKADISKDKKIETSVDATKAEVVEVNREKNSPTVKSNLSKIWRDVIVEYKGGAGGYILGFLSILLAFIISMTSIIGAFICMSRVSKHLGSERAGKQKRDTHGRYSEY